MQFVSWRKFGTRLHVGYFDSRKVGFLLSGDVQAQASNLCVDHEVHEGTLKYIGKKHYTL